MKATINGVTVEGTPQEIMEYERLMKGEKPKLSQVGLDQATGKSLLDGLTKRAKQYGIYTVVSVNKPGIGNCSAAMNGGCYCTGACQTQTL